jgi:hypothetical protein
MTMKDQIKLVGALLFTCVLIGCAPESEKDNAARPERDAALPARSIARLYLQEHVVDQDSLKIEREVTTEGKSEYGDIVSIDFRAKNAFGGYVREHWIFIISSEGKIVSVIPVKK